MKTVRFLVIVLVILSLTAMAKGSSPENTNQLAIWTEHNLEFLQIQQGEDQSYQRGWKPVANGSFSFSGGSSGFSIQYHNDDKEEQNPIVREIDLQIDSLSVVLDYFVSVIIPCALALVILVLLSRKQGMLTF